MVIKNKIGFPHLNYKTLRKICSMKPTALAEKYGLQEVETVRGKYWFQDNGADILAVAHVDSALPFLHYQVLRLRPDTFIYCPTLDDRLGAYIILDWLPQAGVKIDILLTDNEEKGISTGLYFKPVDGKKYNWMFMFDREGTTVATYDYGDDAVFKRALTNHDFAVLRGTYSCIADMDELGCRGLNIGAGYHQQHTNFCYASRSELIKNLRRFLNFYKAYRSVAFPYEPPNSYYNYSPSKQGELSFADNSLKLLNPKIETDKTKIKTKIQEIKEKLAARHKIKPEGIETLEEIIKEDTTGNQKAAITAILQQDIKILNIPSATIQKLYENDIFIVAEIASKSRVELLNLGTGSISINHQDVDFVKKAFDGLGLWFCMNVNHYGVKLPFEPTDEMLEEATQWFEIANKKANKGKVGESIEIPIKKSDAAVVLYALPHTRKQAFTQAKAIKENGYSVKLMDVCVRCHNEYEVEITETESEIICPKCKSEKKSQGYVTIDEALEIKRKSGPSVYRIGNVLTGMQLKRKKNDKTRFEIGEEGPAWIEPKQVGFEIPSGLVY